MASKGKKERIAQQPDGQPQGRHLAGFKGMKTDGICLCGNCHPNAQKGKQFVRIIDPNRKKAVSV